MVIPDSGPVGVLLRRFLPPERAEALTRAIVGLAVDPLVVATALLRQHYGVPLRQLSDALIADLELDLRTARRITDQVRSAERACLELVAQVVAHQRPAPTAPTAPGPVRTASDEPAAPTVSAVSTVSAADVLPAPTVPAEGSLFGSRPGLLFGDHPRWSD